MNHRVGPSGAGLAGVSSEVGGGGAFASHAYLYNSVPEYKYDAIVIMNASSYAM